MDKKTIIMVAALVLVLLFYFQIMEFLGMYTPATPTEPTEQPTVDTIVQQQPMTPPVQATTETLPGATAVLDQAQPDTTVAVDTICVNTNKYELVLTSAGGGPVSMVLKEYTYRDGEQIRMLIDPTAATPDAVFAGGTFSSAAVNYTSNLMPGNYEVTSEPLELVYSYRLAEGGAINKHYRFYPDNYHYDMTIEVNEREKLGFERSYEMRWNTPLGITEPQPETDYQAMEAVVMQAGQRETLDDFDNGRLNQTLEGDASWAGVRSKYFAAVIIPTSRDAESVTASGTKSKVETPDGSIEKREITVGLRMAFANVSNFSDDYKIFVGPLDYSVLSDYDVGLEDMLGIGTTPFIGWIIKPFALAIIWVLPKMYSFIPNYGLVIILFAFLIKIITLPLSMKSFKSMNAMKELQPKLEELKKKHKKNPQALNAETMKLYKAHGVNPISGCLPMLPQMPLFFALFSVFRSTILLRNAPFVWFFTDLSRGASGFTDP
ncbi:MAG: membrane protein insertase YidC, partial [candidate division Zixibacteria bacterium]|nr:membrane protein insertase YidC [candidate division Zixibacteria bacterium]